MTERIIDIELCKRLEDIHRNKLTIWNLVEEPDFCLRLKSYIAFFRRSMHAYPSTDDLYWPKTIETKFDEFKIFIHDNIETIMTLNTRWLVSILDCFINVGTPQDRISAVFISTIVNMERCRLVTNPEIREDFNEHCIWAMWPYNYDGMGDLIKNIAINTTSDTKPFVKEIFSRLMDIDTFLITQTDDIHNKVIENDIVPHPTTMVGSKDTKKRFLQILKEMENVHE